MFALDSSALVAAQFIHGATVIEIQGLVASTETTDFAPVALEVLRRCNAMHALTVAA
jgi:hypothetical protein